MCSPRARRRWTPTARATSQSCARGPPSGRARASWARDTPTGTRRSSSRPPPARTRGSASRRGSARDPARAGE
eukprot:5987437-Alexandrium_andersonii.AAC.1